MKRLVALAAALAMLLGACAYGPSNGNSNPAPAPTGAGGPTDCAYNIYDKACYPPSPVASADNAPPGPTAHASGSGGGFNCQVDIDPQNTGLHVGAGIIAATAYTYCTLPPVPSTFNFQMAIQRLNTGSSNWYNWPPPAYSSNAIPPMFPGKLPERDFAPCEAGVYRLWIKLSGLTGDKKPRKFGPLERTANVINITEADCKGKLTPR